MSVVGFV